MSTVNIENKLICSGPYTLLSWKRNESIILKAVENSFLYDKEMVKELIFKIIPDENSRITQLKKGEIDLLEALNTEAISELKKMEHIKTIARTGRDYDYIDWNNIDPELYSKRKGINLNKFFGNPNVRIALSLAINKEEILNEYLQGYGQLSFGPVSPIYKSYYNNELKPYEYSPSKAKEILSSEGWTDLDQDGFLEKNNLEFSFKLFIASDNPPDTCVARGEHDGIVALQAGRRSRRVRVDPPAQLPDLRRGDPQHPPNNARRLDDRFHAENTYAICLDGDELVGMIAGRCARPFSLDQKVPDLDRHLPPHRRVVEVRLLAVDPRHRKRSVFARLAGVLANHFRAQGCDLAIISGTVRELPLYRHLGFRPFGPLVGDTKARYQPMFLTLENYAASAAHLEVVGGRSATNLMPGPVALREPVRAAFAQPPISHRSVEFAALMRRVRGRLRELCVVHDALVMPGSGTLANDAIANSNCLNLCECGVIVLLHADLEVSPRGAVDVGVALIRHLCREHGFDQFYVIVADDVVDQSVRRRLDCRSAVLGAKEEARLLRDPLVYLTRKYLPTGCIVMVLHEFAAMV